MDKRSERAARAERLRLAREKAGYPGPNYAANAERFPLETYKAHESGRNGFDVDVGRVYAKRFGVSLSWLMLGEGDMGGARRVTIIGYIGAGAAISVNAADTEDAGLEDIEVPFSLPGEMIGFRIKGDSMLPRYDDGDVIVAWRHQRLPTDDYIGEEAVVRTDEGNLFLKRVMRGASPGRYNLESWNARTMEDVAIEWIGEVYILVRAPIMKRHEIVRQKRP